MEQSSLYKDLLEALLDGGVDAITRVAHRQLGRPVMVTDGMYHQLAMYPRERIDDFVWQKMVDGDQNYEGLLQAMRELDLLDKLFVSKQPLVIDRGEFESARRVFSALQIDGEIYGFSVFLFDEDAVTPADLATITLINSVLSLELKKQKGKAYSVNRNENLFLLALLAGDIKTLEDLNDWKFNMIVRPNGDFCMIAAVPRGGGIGSLQYSLVEEDLRRIDPGLPVVIFDDKLYILLSNIEGLADYGERAGKIAELLAKHNLRSGVSYLYDNILDTRIFRDQADYALLCCIQVNEADYAFYRQYAFDAMVTSMIKNMSVLSFEPPGLRLLRDYDRENNAELYRTLREYIVTFKDTAATLKRLHIHRNTLPYRLRKIEEMTGFNLDDAKLCSQLLFFYLYEMGNFNNMRPQHL